MASKRFNLGDYNLPGMSVSAPETEQIELLPLDLIDPDPNNFSSLEGIDELAANIETVGLLDPLRVRPVGERYTLVSGHRRRAACMLIRDGGSEMFKNGVPSIVERGEASDALRELRLLSANSATRIMSDADLSKQAERMTAVLYQLKQEGYKFPGKMRTIVAQACQVSESKLARLHAIRANLCEPMLGMFDKGRLNESVAYRISQETPETQERIWKDQGDVLHNLTADGISAYLAHVRFLDSQKAAAEASGYDPKAAVNNYLADRVKEDRQYFEMLKYHADAIIRRSFGHAGVAPGPVFYERREAIDRMRRAYLHSGSGGMVVDYEGKPKGLELRSSKKRLRILRTWTEVYDMLCVLMIQKADQATKNGPPRASAPTDAPEWMTGVPPRIGRYFCRVDMGDSKPHENRCWWGDDGWSCDGSNLKANGWKVVGWWPLPKEG